MAGSTTPIVLMGATTMLADYLNDHKVEWRVAIATAIGAGIFSVAENLDTEVVTAMAWLFFVGSLVVPVSGRPASVVVFQQAWSKS